MTILMFGQLVADLLRSSTERFVERKIDYALNYEGMDLETKSPLKRSEVMLRLAKLIDREGDQGGRFRLEILDDEIKIRSGTLWGPDFVGTIESFDEGSVLKGSFIEGRGATFSYGAVVVGFIPVGLLVLTTPWPGAILAVFFSAVFLWFGAGIFKVRKHKAHTIPRLTAEIMKQLCADP